MKQLIQKLRSFPYYVFGIVLFFVSHGYSENAGLIPFREMLFFFLVTATVAISILWFLRKKLGSVHKAGIITGLLLFFYLFYGAIQDAFKQYTLINQFSRYRALLPFIITLIVVSYFFIKRSTYDFKKITVYINTVLILLILVDFTSISQVFFKAKDADELEKIHISTSLVPCDSCEKPDIYLIVLDEYWGTSSLKSYFGYDNGNFTSFLKGKGFFVASKPSCNYTCTPVSMAATLDMKYMEWLNGHKNAEVVDYALGAKLISNNTVVSYLKSLGYGIKNYSIFDIDGYNAVFDVSELPVKLKLITAKTLWERINTDLGWNIRVGFASKHKWLAQIFQNKYKKGNEGILKSINLEMQNKQANQPRFVYAHFLMPHFPYVYDSAGNEKYNHSYFNPGLSRIHNDSAYLQYLIYTNKVVESIVSNIFTNAKTTPVILLMSDHGNRNFSASDKSVSANNNFNAVFLPKRNYDLFYDSISNVNQFRVLFNTLFNQHLPILKDSVVF